MRQEDEYLFEANHLPGSIYDLPANNGSVPAFRTFIRKAARKNPTILPPWWTEEKTEACVAYGLRTDHDHSLKHAVEKSDVQRIWADDKMPMKLRMLGERVWGNTPGGTRSDGMLALMMAMEARG